MARVKIWVNKRFYVTAEEELDVEVSDDELKEILNGDYSSIEDEAILLICDGKSEEIDREESNYEYSVTSAIEVK